MDDDQWRRGFALLERHGFSLDLQTPWWHFDAAADLARDFLRSCCCTPACRRTAALEGLDDRRRALEIAALQPNVAIKIAGLGRPGCRGRSPPMVR